MKGKQDKRTTACYNGTSNNHKESQICKLLALAVTKMGKSLVLLIDVSTACSIRIEFSLSDKIEDIL